MKFKCPNQVDSPTVFCKNISQKYNLLPATAVVVWKNLTEFRSEGKEKVHLTGSEVLGDSEGHSVTISDYQNAQYYGPIEVCTTTRTFLLVLSFAEMK